ncbi:MAG: hypothetical protein ACLU3U_09730 [Gallintestinimicrobium sp.]
MMPSDTSDATYKAWTTDQSISLEGLSDLCRKPGLDRHFSSYFSGWENIWILMKIYQALTGLYH